MASLITNYQCPACTGPLHFTGQSGMLECDYCQSRYTVEEIEKLYNQKNIAAEQSFEKTETSDGSEWDVSGLSNQWGEDGEKIKAYICPSCAAEIICDETTAATSCPYCRNPTVVPGQFGGDLKPDYVLPFKLSHEDAKKALLNYYKDKKFLPKEFSDKNKISELKGVYVPFWLYDCNVDVDMTFEGRIVDIRRHGDYQITKTSYYDVQREATVPFKNIPVDASKNMPDTHMDAIEPFDYSQLKPFSMSYLPGFLAERYGLSAEECMSRAESRAETTAEAEVRSDVQGFTDFSIKSKNLNLRRGKVSYALLPVYMLTTKYNGQNYLFAMNGQTGKFIGNLPVSKQKYWLYFLGIFAMVTVLAGAALMMIL